MKIDRIRPASGINAYESTRRVYNAQKTVAMGNDKAEISTDALSFAATLKALKSDMASSARGASDIEGLQERVSKGEYNIDAGLVAERLLTGIKLDKNA